MKKVVTLSLSLSAALILTACGGGGSSNDDKSDTNASTISKNPDDLKGRALLRKYAPKECYKSVSSTNTVIAGGSSSTHEQYADLRLKTFVTISYLPNGCVLKSWHHPDRQGQELANAACSSLGIIPKPTLPDTFFRSKFYCPETLDVYRNIKMTKLEGKDAIYAETSIQNARAEVWFNLKPFYMIKDIIYSPGDPVAISHHTVKINENIDSDIFKMPKK